MPSLYIPYIYPLPFAFILPPEIVISDVASPLIPVVTVLVSDSTFSVPETKLSIAELFCIPTDDAFIVPPVPLSFIVKFPLFIIALLFSEVIVFPAKSKIITFPFSIFKS